MKNLFSLNFWLKLNPGPLVAIGQNILIGFLLFLFVAMIAFWMIKSKANNLHTRFWSKLYGFAFTNFGLGLVLYFFTYEQIPFFSSRFWFLLWGISMVVWLYFVFGMLKEIPEKKKRIEEAKEFQKYIP